MGPGVRLDDTLLQADSRAVDTPHTPAVDPTAVGYVAVDSIEVDHDVDSTVQGVEEDTAVAAAAGAAASGSVPPPWQSARLAKSAQSLDLARHCS